MGPPGFQASGEGPPSPLLLATCMITNELISSLRFHVDCKANRIWSELTCMSIHQAATTSNTALRNEAGTLGCTPNCLPFPPPRVPKVVTYI